MLKYNNLKNYFYNRSYGNTKEAIISRVLNKAEALVGEKDIELFYPKNLFVEDKCFELYLFCYDHRIIKIREEDGKFIVTSFLNKNNIEKVMLKENYENDYEKVLKIKFKGDEVFQFNSRNDTNEHHRKNLADIIEQIFANITLRKNTEI